MTEVTSAILLDGFLAAIAAVGFGAISDPPRRAFPAIALLAGIGHALRFCMVHYVGIDIVTASLAAGLAVGLNSLWLGSLIRCPMPVLYIPALLPMIPGMYAYRTVQALVMFLQSLDNPADQLRYMQEFFRNGILATSILAMLAVGAAFPIFFSRKRIYSLTRRRS